MWQGIDVQCKIRNEEYASFRPTQVRRTATGLRSNTIAAQIEPLRLYPLFYSSVNANNFGLEHPDLQKLLDEAINLFDDEARWAKQAEIAHWFFDNVVDISLYAEAAVWPLGPTIDEWE
jgi:ABC-type transport system substrate-binding protein